MRWYDGLFEQLEALRDEIQSRKMAAYMQNNFQFLGLKKPSLDAVTKPFLKAVRNMPLDWNFVLMCWAKPYREAQYIAVGYISMHQKEMCKDDLKYIQSLITRKSWWDTVDMLDGACGTLVEKYPELKATMLEWSCADNIWLRRTAINFQQKYKDRTDKKLLAQIIENNLGSSEFFINKAIGWSLRETSKVDPQWVRDFIDQNRETLSPLSKREASKYI